MPRVRPRKQFKIMAKIFDKRGKLISMASNSYQKTHPYQSKLAKEVGKPEAIYLHAEIAAILKLPKNAKAHTILVERYNTNGQPVLAKPCAICMKAINAKKINNILYT
jgi:tRNA(Arg) A34 adenosine deaminase TadA